MRALLSFRFVAAVAGIFVLLFMVRSVTAGDEVDQAAANTSTTPVSRVINLTERLDRSTKRFSTDPEGLATSTVTFTIEEQRAVHHNRMHQNSEDCARDIRDIVG